MSTHRIGGKKCLLAALGVTLAIFWGVAAGAGCSIKYVLQAGVGQTRLLMARVPVEQTLANPETPASIKEKLTLIGEAKTYGEEKVGLVKTENYTSYVPLDRQSVSWNLMASPKLKLAPVTWWFPVVGRVPYLGYFKKKQGLKKEKRLRKKGYDTYLRPAAAYSTLGYFKDPIFSSLLDYDKPILANIILHELTHTTVFIEGHVAYNEGLATFVGNRASIEFLSRKYGPDSKEVRVIRDYVYNDKVFSKFLRKLYNRLNDLYDSDLPDGEKMTRRERLFDEAVEEFNGLPFRGDPYRSFTRETLNNAAVLSRAIYFVDLDMFEGLYAALGDDLPACVNFFKELEKKVKDGSVKDPAEYTRNYYAKK